MPTSAAASSRRNTTISRFMSKRAMTVSRASKRSKRRRSRGPSAENPTVIHYGEHEVRSAVLDAATLRSVLSTAEKGDLEAACWIANTPPRLVGLLLFQAGIDYRADVLHRLQRSWSK